MRTDAQHRAAGPSGTLTPRPGNLLRRRLKVHSSVPNVAGLLVPGSHPLALTGRVSRAGFSFQAAAEPPWDAPREGRPPPGAPAVRVPLSGKGGQGRRRQHSAAQSRGAGRDPAGGMQEALLCPVFSPLSRRQSSGSQEQMSKRPTRICCPPAEGPGPCVVREEGEQHTLDSLKYLHSVPRSSTLWL